MEVAEQGLPAGRTQASDARHGVGRTESAERHVIRAGDEFTIGPGQTWCVVTSAVEGETTLTVTARAAPAGMTSALRPEFFGPAGAFNFRHR